MELTGEQQAVVDHPGRRVTVVGAAGTGKTTALVARYGRVVAASPPSQVLVACRDRAAAQRFLSAVLPTLRGGFDALPVTTAYGLAYDVVRRAATEPVRLLGGAERRALLRRLLLDESPADWPALGHLIHRPAFVDEVARALEIALPQDVPTDPRWAELAGFVPRYQAALAAAGATDGRGLLEAAVPLAALDRFAHVLVDDAGDLPAAAAKLLDAFAPSDAQLSLTRPFRVAAPGRLVRCGHPSTEPEAVAGELLAAAKAGVPWPRMAVLVRTLGPQARSIGRALARHGIAVVPVPGLAVDEPVVRAVVDLLRWAAGDVAALDRLLVSPLARLDPSEVRAIRRDAAANGTPLAGDPRLAGLVALRDDLRRRHEAGDTPADLAYEAWAAGLTHVGTTGLGAVDDRALDALVAFVDGLAAHADRHATASLPETLAALDDGTAGADPWRTSPTTTPPQGVTITSVAAAAGREWHTVVVAGCVEGTLPRTRVRTPLFAAAPPTFDDERRLFDIATTRATGTLTATAAPQPGVLLSRFVEAWPESPPTLPLAPGRPAPSKAPTHSDVPVAAGGRLVLSASQLDTYDDCPLRYAYQYVLRARDEPGVHAALGTLVHEVLAAFLDPADPDPPARTEEGLMALADRLWHDDIARYRPQAEEARRDFVTMLRSWWESEGAALEPHTVVATERTFEIEVGPHTLRGSIDRVDRTPEGLRIIDYKTGKHEPRPGEVADDLQLAVYHLAASRDPELAALGPPAQLELRYLRSQHALPQPVAEDHANRTESRVLAVAQRILAEDFEPAVDANCRTCSFHRLCPLQDAGRR